jgi:polyisoprenoid-binding protein YceI
MMKRIVAALAVLAPALAFPAAAAWKIDPAHTQSNFTVRHLVISNVRGEFKNTTGTVRIDDQDLSRSSVEAVIDATTIHTREDKRDAHLRSPDFFDVEKYPKITFKSSKVEKAGDGYKVMGDLTMHGVTRPVVLDVTSLTPEIKDPYGMSRRGVSARTTVNRQDFGLKWSKSVEAGPVVGDEVKIEIEAELIKDSPASPAAQQAAQKLAPEKAPQKKSANAR